MPIEYRDPREPEALFALAEKAGIAEGKIKAQAEAHALQRLAIESEIENNQYAWRKSLDFEYEKRARVWEIEKMEIRSRTDFEKEERTRQQKIDQHTQAKQAIIDSTMFDNNFIDPVTGQTEQQLVLFDNDMKFLGYNIPAVEEAMGRTQMLRGAEGLGLTPEQIQQAYAVKLGVPASVMQKPSLASEISPLATLNNILSKYRLEKGKLMQVDQFGATIEPATPEQIQLYSQAKKNLAKIVSGGKEAGGIKPTQLKQYKLGDPITRGGVNYKIVGFRADGVPLCEKK